MSKAGGVKMTQEELVNEANWDEATRSGNYVSFETDKEKILVLTNWKLIKTDKFGKDEVEFEADVVEEDGKATVERKFSTTSTRLKKKLRPLLEEKNPQEDRVKISVLKVGERYDTQYSVKVVE